MRANPNADFSVLFSDFNSTTVTFVAHTDAAKKRIYGGVSAEIYKSAAPQFLEELKAEGFSVNVQ